MASSRSAPGDTHAGTAPNCNKCDKAISGEG